jgi:predicted nuclease of restriction endonuclease-like (RecB) superfamily
MRAFYQAWTEEVKKLPRSVAEADGQNLPQPVAEIPWGHNVWLLEKVKNPAERLWYARQALLHGWSRPVLVHQIGPGKPPMKPVTSSVTAGL